MAIIGAGSDWDGRELKGAFFNDSNYVIGWGIADAQDLYALISTVKVGDIIYLKANRPGSLDIRVKGIGIVTKTLMRSLFDVKVDLARKSAGFELSVNWLVKDEFKISIPSNTGKLTNIRAATLYEEYMPYVQDAILGKLFSKIQ